MPVPEQVMSNQKAVIERFAIELYRHRIKAVRCKPCQIKECQCTDMKFE